MPSRAKYNRELGEAIDKCLAGRTAIWISDLAIKVYAFGFPGENAPPAPTTLAKMLVGRGWIKKLSNMPGAMYVAPAIEETH